MVTSRVIPLLCCLGLAACATPAERPVRATQLPGNLYIGDNHACDSGSADMVRYTREHKLETCKAGGWQPVPPLAVPANAPESGAAALTAKPFKIRENSIMPGPVDIGPDFACGNDSLNVSHYRADHSLEICSSIGWRPIEIQAPAAAAAPPGPATKPAKGTPR